MIYLKNVNKYFNKGRKNQIHVIDNTTLSIDSTGLVALLGPSGCGKTTLLNSIGGLDKIKSGSIYINDKKITSKMSYFSDKLRAISIGYIFQDYKLIENLSVYENITLVLKMIGLKDKKEIKKRTDYVLNKVGMFRYRFRPAGMLSGGEQQRVAIARAIVKNPDIILADEPTGNLDSKNSLEIMKIIKSISKDKLVILVTHEQNLAKFYANRIIEIEDGKIVNDYVNNHNDNLDYDIENRLYLKDFKYKSNLSEGITIYGNSKTKLNIKIVVKDDNIYIESDKNVELVNDDSAIELIDDHYKSIEKKDIDAYDFGFSTEINDSYKKKYHSVISIFTSIRKGFIKIFDMSFIKKALLLGFFISAMFIIYCVCKVASTMNIKDDMFVNKNKNYLEIVSNNTKVNDYLLYEKNNDIDYVIPGNSLVTFKVKYDEYYQTSTDDDSLTGSLSSINYVSSKDLLKGVLPSNDYEIVVDKKVIQNMFKNTKLAKMSGISSVYDMLNKNVYINNLNAFKIVGIVDMKSPSIYVNNSNFINIIDNGSALNNNVETTENQIMDYNLFQDKLELKKGRVPSNDYEVIVNISNQENMPLNKQISTKVAGNKLTVVGYYYSRDNYNNYYVSSNTNKYKVITSNKNIIVATKNKKLSLKYYRSLNLNINDTYSNSKKDYINSISKSNHNTIVISSIIIIISLIEIYLMIRASFLSRIKEIGIYRAIGIKKLDIYKMFFGEIFAITTIGSIPGVLFMSYIIKQLSQISYLSNLFIINKSIILFTIIFIYIFNLLIGLLPVNRVVRKKPSIILSRYDLD